jgi:hypothetical protein
LKIGRRSKSSDIGSCSGCVNVVACFVSSTFIGGVKTGADSVNTCSDAVANM